MHKQDGCTWLIADAHCSWMDAHHSWTYVVLHRWMHMANASWGMNIDIVNG